MKRKIASEITLTLLLLATAIGVTAIPWDGVPDDPTPAQAIWVDPKTITCFDEGDTFVVDVLINITSPTQPGGGTGLFGFEYKLFWNLTVLEVTSIQYHSPLPMPPALLIKNETGVWSGGPKDGLGYHWLGITAVFGQTPFTGVTSLSTYAFEVMVGDGSSDLDIYEEELVDDTGTLIALTTVDGYVTIPSFCIIKANGSVYPPTAPISNVGNVIYTLTRSINKSIIVERNNIVFDGAGHTLHKTGNRIGIDLSDRSNVIVKNIGIEKFSYGIYLNHSASNSILGNAITANNLEGIHLYESPNNNITGNNIIANGLFGVVLNGSSSNTIAENNLIDNNEGIRLYESSNNSVAGNNIANNYYGIFLAISSNNSVHGNDVTDNNGQGIRIEHSSNNSICGNNIESNNWHGIRLFRSSNNNVSANNVTDNNGIGIGLWNSANNSIHENTVTDNLDGIGLSSSSNNSICGNNITANDDQGMSLEYSSNNNSIHENIIANNYYGIWLIESANNSIYHNNIQKNTQQVHIGSPYNIWDDGYPSGGNYWSHHNPPDVYSGPYQNITGRDRIGDIPYIMDENNTDGYPLIYPYGYVPTIDLNYDGKISISDIVLCALAFGSKPGDAIWNPYVDINQDGKVSMQDIVLIALHFGETWPP